MTEHGRRTTALNVPGGVVDARNSRMNSLRLGKLDTPRMGRLREKVKEDLVRDGPVMRAFLVGHVLCGIGLITLSVYLNVVEKNFVEFTVTFLGTMDMSYEAMFQFFAWGPLVAGIACIVLTFVAVYATSQNTHHDETLDDMLDRVSCKMSHRLCHEYCGSTSRGTFRVIMGLLAALFLVQIAFASMYVMLLNTVLGSAEGNDGTTLGPVEAEVTTLQLAMYNLCCDEPGWSAHDTVPVCDENGQPPESCGLTGDAASASDVLCTCYPQADLYAEFYAHLEGSTRICSILSDAIVSISPTQKIPQTNTPLNAFVKASRARIVGFNGEPEDDNVTASEPKGYGCGFGGFARAFQFQQFMYINQQSQHVAVAVIAISVVELILVIGMLCQQLSADDDRFFDKVLLDMDNDNLHGSFRPAKDANLKGRITPFASRPSPRGLPNVSRFDIERDGDRKVKRTDTPDF
ncbi:Hypothetical Protein FCC1311_042082 [Hondaea fermentalgiana]|uniref:Uncharacterized protein n=1 Tax=Hondaea fermentalgiana TaxID=2315210 RepID=A0A2R5GBM5_9STRA|nr:Hypothetical Protein FCC1311_042082 [Hondaea fermentalgiana]|eukprot:GBG27985.1 Hypothetical Protein FCC1311_042082 [Hondaea fermentalgiana]